LEASGKEQRFVAQLYALDRRLLWPPQPSLPAVRHAIVDLIIRPPQRCPHCRRWIGIDTAGTPLPNGNNEFDDVDDH
jgi:hypothetical protein